MSERVSSGSEVPPRPAATVILLRDSADGILVWLMQRAETLVFGPGKTVFPGGSVDASDARLEFGGVADDEVAPAIRAAAYRETFEETGLLLGTTLDLAGSRAAVEDGTLDFPTLLGDHGVRPDPSLLRPWARWITPPGRPRRYDTWFFVAECGAGAQPRAETGEAVAAGWNTPARALADAEAGLTGLMRPTRAILSSLTRYGSAAAVLADAANQNLEPVRNGVPHAVSG